MSNVHSVRVHGDEVQIERARTGKPKEVDRFWITWAEVAQAASVLREHLLNLTPCVVPDLPRATRPEGPPAPPPGPGLRFDITSNIEQAISNLDKYPPTSIIMDAPLDQATMTLVYCRDALADVKRIITELLGCAQEAAQYSLPERKLVLETANRIEVAIGLPPSWVELDQRPRCGNCRRVLATGHQCGDPKTWGGPDPT